MIISDVYIECRYKECLHESSTSWHSSVIQGLIGGNRWLVVMFILKKTRMKKGMESLEGPDIVNHKPSPKLFIDSKNKLYTPPKTNE